MSPSNRSEEWFRVVVETSPHAVMVAQGGRIAVVNAACLRLFAADDVSQLLGLELQALFGADLPQAMAAAEAKPEAGTEPPAFLTRVVRLDGRARALEVRLGRAPDLGAGAGVLQIVLRDVTERVLNDRLGDVSGDKLRRLSGSLVEAREDERRRIARELHDELGQRLSAIKMEISSLLAGLPANVTSDVRVADAMRLIDQTMSSVRRIAANVRPAMLDDLGLEAAIEWLTSDWAQRSGLAITVHCDPVGDLLGDGAKTAVYRTVQEALTNVTRHARARRVDVELRQEPTQVLVAVSDNGQGMAPDAIGKNGSFGLIGMRERALLLGGTLAIKEASLGGCRLELRLPLEHQADSFSFSSQGIA